jgi:hypothetical protein
MSSSVGMMKFPIYGKNNPNVQHLNVPNHQPDESTSCIRPIQITVGVITFFDNPNHTSPWPRE